MFEINHDTGDLGAYTKCYLSLDNPYVLCDPNWDNSTSAKAQKLFRSKIWLMDQFGYELYYFDEHDWDRYVLCDCNLSCDDRHIVTYMGTRLLYYFEHNI